MKSIRFLSSTLSAALLFFCITSGTGFAAEPANHVVNDTEIQAQVDTQLHSEAADRQAIRDLMTHPEFQRIAGAAGLDLQRADAAVGVLSGAELQRLASQARQANADIIGGKTVMMTWTMVIVIVAAIVILVAVL
jgi:hypothetical protein